MRFFHIHPGRRSIYLKTGEDENNLTYGEITRVQCDCNREYERLMLRYGPSYILISSSNSTSATFHPLAASSYLTGQTSWKTTYAISS